jgi:hypothetical protein
MVLDLISRAIARLVDEVTELKEEVVRDAREGALGRTLRAFRGEEVEVEIPGEEETQTIEIQDISENFADEFGGLLGELPEEAQETILDSFRREELEDRENVRDQLQDAEGAALALGLGGIGANLAIEATGKGELESQQFITSQILTAVALEDILGAEIGVTMQEAVIPMLEQEINEEQRRKQVDLQDAIEQQLRNKDADEDYLDGLGTYGIRPEEVGILEEVALQQIEFEELLETPAELGKIVPPEVLEAELDRAGYAEETKEFLRETAEVLPESARTYQELLRTEELVRSLDTLAQDGVVSPEEALETIPDQVEANDQAFLDRFDLLRDLPAGSPSGADFEKSFHQGYIDLAQLRDRLDQTEYPTGDFEEVLRTVVRDEIDGDLQESLALGLLSEAQYGELMDFVGLDAETQAALIAGQDLGDVAESRLQEAAPAGDRPVSAIPGIGQSRSTALEAVGIQTFGDLAGSDADTVADAAQVSPETAQEFIDLATQASG